MGYEAGQGETARLAQEATCPRPAGPGQKPAPQASPPQSRPSFPHLRRTPQPPPPGPGPDPSPSPCSYLGCASGVSLKKLRFDRALLLLSIAANLPQLLIWHSRLPHSADLASSPCFPHPLSTPFPLREACSGKLPLTAPRWRDTPGYSKCRVQMVMSAASPSYNIFNKY